MTLDPSTRFYPTTPVRSAQVAPLSRRRAGDAERGTVCDQLAAHYAAGRLSAEELEARLDAAMGATYLLQLTELLSDLPPLQPIAAVPAPPAAAGPRKPWSLLDVLALLTVLTTLVIAGILVLGLGVAGGFVVIFFGFLGGLTAAAGGAALVHLAHSRLRNAAS